MAGGKNRARSRRARTRARGRRGDAPSRSRDPREHGPVRGISGSPVGRRLRPEHRPAAQALRDRRRAGPRPHQRRPRQQRRRQSTKHARPRLAAGSLRRVIWSGPMRGCRQADEGMQASAECSRLVVGLAAARRDREGFQFRFMLQAFKDRGDTGAPPTTATGCSAAPAGRGQGCQSCARKTLASCCGAAVCLVCHVSPALCCRPRAREPGGPARCARAPRTSTADGAALLRLGDGDDDDATRVPRAAPTRGRSRAAVVATNSISGRSRRLAAVGQASLRTSGR